MSWTTDLLHGIAADLATAGIGVWQPDGPAYSSGQTGIYIASLRENPDTAICLTDYPLTQLGAGDMTVGLQVRTRAGADVDAVTALRDAVFDRLNGREHLSFGSVRVALIAWQSGVWLGENETHRMERTDNYWITAARASALSY